MLVRHSNYIIGNATRISIGLLLIVISTLGISYTLGLLPNRDKDRMQRQLDMARSLAIQFSAAVEHRDINHVQSLAGSVIGSLPDVISIGLRRTDGRLEFAADDHATLWQDANAGRGGSQPIQVAIFDRDKPWGNLELVFRVEPTSFRSGTTGLILFVGLSSLLGFLLFMKRTLRLLDPSQVVPERVRSMLDTLAEGAAIVDSDGRIVLANQSLARIVNKTDQQLLGRQLAELPWTPVKETSASDESAGEGALPWSETTGDVKCRGRMVKLRTDAGLRSLAVNASSILGGRGGVRGCLFTFDDVTGVEQKNQQLVEMVDQLGQAQQRVQKQNEELRRLATRDPLTDCLNRRTFHEQVETFFALARRQQQPLSVIMVDIDHFKSVNDNHGHARGDEVLRGLAQVLSTQVRTSDVVCRYGGEEFCLLLPATDLEGATRLARKLCDAISAAKIADMAITASLGVSCTTLKADSALLLIDQADQALYNSKHAGRNRASRFDQLDPSLLPAPAEREAVEDVSDERIPVHAVRSLLAALSFRDPQTAEHSRRVAELCVKAGAAWLNPRELFVLETAAALHDIGKVGVPDSVLLKPGPLTEEEWRLMRQHDHIGLEIIQTAFNCPQLADIIACHHARHESNPDPSKARDGFVPMCARLLGIADAYDAMTTHRVYRVARPREAAFEELRRCAGTQFDPLLVKHFISVISASSGSVASDRHAEQMARVLRLGMEAEMMVSALLRKDLEATAALAKHLTQIAGVIGSEQLAHQCRQVVSSIESDADPQALLTEAQGILDAITDRAVEWVPAEA